MIFSKIVSSPRYGHPNHVIVDVINITKTDGRLRNGLVIGSLHKVSTVTPLTRLFNTDTEADAVGTEPVKVEVDQVSVEKDIGDSDVDVDLKWDVSRLENEEERLMMEEMLCRWVGVFSKDDLDIGDIPEFQMPMHITDLIPITAKYRNLPPHL